MNTLKCIILLLLTFAGSVSATENHISFKYGVDKTGAVTKAWLTQDKEKKPLTVNEQAWADLISAKRVLWKTQFDSIAVPFTDTKIPHDISVVIGNRGGRDAFTFTSKYPTTIFFNVSVLARSYGDATTRKNETRISRIFAHEYTHLLQHQWSLNNPYPLTTPLEQALNQSYKEGFGHFRSISHKWKDENGLITQRAEHALLKLESVFVDRIIALNKANDAEAKKLMRGLSTGPFNKKWGALTVALWLTKEAQGNDEKLQKWVNKGPQGILALANLHLSNSLKIKLNQALNRNLSN